MNFFYPLDFINILYKFDFAKYIMMNHTMYVDSYQLQIINSYILWPHRNKQEIYYLSKTLYLKFSFTNLWLS